MLEHEKETIEGVIRVRGEIIERIRDLGNLGVENLKID